LFVPARKVLDDFAPASFCLLVALSFASTAFGQKEPFHVLAFYSMHVERDHVDFALQAIPFFEAMAKRDNFEFKATSNWMI